MDKYNLKDRVTVNVNTVKETIDIYIDGVWENEDKHFEPELTSIMCGIMIDGKDCDIDVKVNTERSCDGFLNADLLLFDGSSHDDEIICDNVVISCVNVL
jgi:hypothetical protein